MVIRADIDLCSLARAKDNNLDIRSNQRMGKVNAG